VAEGGGEGEMEQATMIWRVVRPKGECAGVPIV
jgi:hypothetical protein